MPTSQNGYSANDRSVIASLLVPGSTRRLAVRAGDVSVVLLDLAAWIHRNVRPIDVGTLDDWGYAERTIRGSSTTLSNHASGTAIDLDALLHPLGARNTWSATDKAKIHGRLAYYNGVVRWGEDYDGRPDGMHFEINAGAAAVKAVADKIRAAGYAAPSPSAVPAAGAPREDDEDEMDIPITVHPNGRFVGHGIAESAGSGWYGEGIVSFATAFGASRVWVSAFDGNGYQWSLSAKGGDLIGQNCSRPYRLPAGARHVVIEGDVEHRPNANGESTRPAAAWLARRA